MTHQFLAISDLALPISFPAIATMVLVCLLGLAISRRLRSNPPLRYVILSGSLVSCWCIPIANHVCETFDITTLRVPYWNSPEAPVVPRMATTIELAEMPWSEPATRFDEEQVVSVEPLPQTTLTDDRPTINWQVHWTSHVWLAGSFILSLFLVRSVILSWRIRASGTDVLEYSRARERAAGQVGIAMTTRVLASNDVSTPLVIGIWNPVVMLPTMLLDQVSPASLEQILVHEFSHVRRRDTLMLFAEAISRVLFWPIVPIHFVIRQLDAVREDLCDNEVLRHHDSIQYARTLLHVASRSVLASPPRRPLATRMVGATGSLEKRVASLIAANRCRATRVSRRVGGAATMILLTIGFGGTGTRLVAIQPQIRPLADATHEAKETGAPFSDQSDHSEFGTLEIAAQLPDGTPVTRKLYGMTKKETSWSVYNGKLMSGPMDVSDTRLRVIHLAENDAVYFSDLITLKSQTPSGRYPLTVMLFPAVTFRGELSANVPRPIEWGVVNAVTLTEPTSDVTDWIRMSWSRSVAIRENGSFELSNFPRDSVIQYIAKCDGWVSASPSKAEFERTIKQHSQFQLKSYRGVAPIVQMRVAPVDERVTVPMVRTSSVKVTVINESGIPMPGVRVRVLTGYFSATGFTGLLDDSFDSFDAFRKHGTADRNVSLDAAITHENSRYSVETNDQGVALIKNLPAAHSAALMKHSVSVYKNGFVAMKDPTSSNPANRSGDRTANAHDGQTTEMKVVMRPVGNAKLNTTLNTSKEDREGALKFPIDVEKAMIMDAIRSVPTSLR